MSTLLIQLSAKPANSATEYLYVLSDDGQSIQRSGQAAASLLPPARGVNFLVRRGMSLEERYFGPTALFNEREKRRLLADYAGDGDPMFLTEAIWDATEGLDPVTRMQQVDLNLWLAGDILLKADKMCMAHSLELRVPFLDRKVMEFAEHIPDRYRINENGNKQVLRHAANKSLPDEWATRPKVGFPVPIVYWLREQKWYDYVKEYFTAPWASEFFNTDELMHLLDLHFAGKGDFQRKIYTPLVFLVWYKRFFIDEDQPAVQAA
mgnify:CR=1 FL=1